MGRQVIEVPEWLVLLVGRLTIENEALRHGMNTAPPPADDDPAEPDPGR